jgi:predicted ATP-dependent Lon-type protease
VTQKSLELIRPIRSPWEINMAELSVERHQLESGRWIQVLVHERNAAPRTVFPANGL